jgi:autotransporter adhesin
MLLTVLCSSVSAQTVFGDVTASSLTAGDVAVVNGVNIGGGLNVGGNAVVGANLGVFGSAGISGNLSVSQDLGVTGNVNANGVGAQSLTAVTATLGTTTAATLNSGSLGVVGNAGVGGDLAVIGDAGVTGNLGVAGTLNANNVSVSGNSYLGGMTVGVNTVSANGNTINQVANGVLQNDAVNVSQLNGMQSNLQNQIDNNKKESRSGIAAVAALSGIPNQESGKKFNVGVGVGHFKSQPAIALGGNARISQNVNSKIGLGISSDEKVFSAGIGYSF